MKNIPVLPEILRLAPLAQNNKMFHSSGDI